MKYPIIILFFIVITICSHFLYSQSQINIYNEEGESLAYVNISMKSKEVGWHSNSVGAIVFDERFLDEEIVLSKVGYSDTSILLNHNLDSIIMEKSPIYEEQHLVSNGNRIVKIGTEKGKNLGFHSVGSRPTIYLNYFQAEQIRGYQLDEFKFKTKSEITSAKVNIRIYAVTESLEPGKYLYEKDIVVSVKKGERMTKVKLNDLNIDMPKNGVFIGIERLLILENIYEYNETNLLTNQDKKKKKFMPDLVLLENKGKNFNNYPSYVYADGNFNKMRGKSITPVVQLKLKRP
ncbi:MAG: hypothetical protein ACQETL_16500 [Bacteroidota bacterium]